MNLYELIIFQVLNLISFLIISSEVICPKLAVK